MGPRNLVIPHVHSREDEFTLVISGRIGARVDDDEYELGPGDLLFEPRDVAHAMWNPTDEPAVSLEFISPAGFEEFFREMGRLHLGGGEVTRGDGCGDRRPVRDGPAAGLDPGPDGSTRCQAVGERVPGTRRDCPATIDLPITMRLAEPPESGEWLRSA